MAHDDLIKGAQQLASIAKIVRGLKRVQAGSTQGLQSGPQRAYLSGGSSGGAAPSTLASLPQTPVIKDLIAKGLIKEGMPPEQIQAIIAISQQASGVPVDIKALMDQIKADYASTTGDIGTAGADWMKEILGANTPDDPAMAALFAQDPSITGYAGSLGQMQETADLNQATDLAWFSKQQQAMVDYYNGLMQSVSAAPMVPEGGSGGGGGSGGYGGGGGYGSGGGNSDGLFGDPRTQVTRQEQLRAQAASKVSERHPDFYTNLTGAFAPGSEGALYAHDMFMDVGQDPMDVGAAIVRERQAQEAMQEQAGLIDESNAAWESALPGNTQTELAQYMNTFGVLPGDNPETEDIVETSYTNPEAVLPANLPFSEELQNQQGRGMALTEQMFNPDLAGYGPDVNEKAPALINNLAYLGQLARQRLGGGQAIPQAGGNPVEMISAAMQAVQGGQGLAENIPVGQSQQQYDDYIVGQGITPSPTNVGPTTGSNYTGVDYDPLTAAPPMGMGEDDPNLLIPDPNTGLWGPQSQIGPPVSEDAPWGSPQPIDLLDDPGTYEEFLRQQQAGDEYGGIPPVTINGVPNPEYQEWLTANQEQIATGQPGPGGVGEQGLPFFNQMASGMRQAFNQTGEEPEPGPLPLGEVLSKVAAFSKAMGNTSLVNQLGSVQTGAQTQLGPSDESAVTQEFLQTDPNDVPGLLTGEGVPGQWGGPATTQGFNEGWGASAINNGNVRPDVLDFLRKRSVDDVGAMEAAWDNDVVPFEAPETGYYREPVDPQELADAARTIQFLNVMEPIAMQHNTYVGPAEYSRDLTDTATETATNNVRSSSYDPATANLVGGDPNSFMLDDLDLIETADTGAPTMSGGDYGVNTNMLIANALRGIGSQKTPVTPPVQKAGVNRISQGLQQAAVSRIGTGLDRVRRLAGVLAGFK